MASSNRSLTAYVSLAAVLAVISYLLSSELIPRNIVTKRKFGYPEDSILNFTERTAEYGYATEEHIVVSEDGYRLTMFRIAEAKNCHGPKVYPPVLLMHGLLQSSDSWIDAGPKSALAYLLADSCYDLWLGNVRGNFYSRSHIKLKPDVDHDFWKFSVDEIGYYDIPAMMQYVLDYTKAKKLNYIGYSQGSGCFYIMCSERPEFCDKANVVISLAPAARQTHTKSVAYRAVASAIAATRFLLEGSGVYEMLPQGSISQELLAYLCQLGWTTKRLCDTVAAVIDSSHPGSVSLNTTRCLFGHFPAGTSIQNMARYGQSFKSPHFQKFDFGEKTNIAVYGSAEPPKYNLTAVSAPVVILYGENDHLVDPKDVKWLEHELPNVIDAIAVTDPLWNHFDVTYSQYIDKLVLPIVNRYLLEYSYSSGERK